MPIMTEFSQRPQEVGEILVKVQEDLAALRERVSAQGDGSNGLDIVALQDAIQQTQHGIKVKTEQMIQQMNNQVITLPNLDGHGLQQSAPSTSVAMETTWDLRTNTHGQDRMALLESRDISRQQLMRQPVFMRKIPEPRLPAGEKEQMAGITPGQAVRQIWNSRIANNPYNPRNRDILHDNYGIQLPLIQRRQTKVPVQQVVKGSTIEPLAVLPRSNRIDPQLLPPPITEDDARRGIISLLDRGLIPPGADLMLEPSPVHHKTLPLHDPKGREPHRPFVANTEASFHLDPNLPKAPPNTEPLSPSPPLHSKPSSAGIISPTKFPESSEPKSRITTGRRISTAMTKLKTPVTVKTLELQPYPPPTTPASGQDYRDRNHRFAIQHGRTRDLTQEFINFKQHYCLSWGSIVTTLKHLEKMLTNYAVPIAFINGDKLADLATEFELEKAPGVEDMLNVIINREDVEKLLQKPGQRYNGPSGKQVAATKIQATYRMYRERQEYLEYRRMKWAAGVIAISWVMNVKMAKVRRQLAATRTDHLEQFRHKAKIFAKNWDRIQSSKHVIIHIPSLGYSKNLRESVNEFNIAQNLQMARLCDIKNPNTDVIYVSPVAVNEEMMQYYSKLLGLKTAIDSGNVDDQADLNERYRIVTPEAVRSFPTHRLCLSSHLKYSPRTVKRIQNLIRGREAYIVTGAPHADDLYLANKLNVPILSPEPEVAHLYSTKSGSKRIFASANVSVPPGEYDIYSLPQLYECLAQLITENLEVTRWLFKLDDEFDGRGIAYIDVAEHMRIYPWALKEAQRYGEKWSKKWAQEAAYIKIHAEVADLLSEFAQPVNKKIYPNWQVYLDAFLRQGGVVEACPPSESVTGLTVDMLIEPNGRISVVCMGDQIHADTPFSCWGMSMPQSSVEPDQLNDVCNSIAEASKARGVVGYFAIDFVTFIHPKTMEQLLWAVDLNLSFSDSLSMFKLTEFITGGRLDTKTHFFDIPPPKKEEKKTRRRRVKEEDEAPNTNRYAVMSTRLRHTNLSVVHYSVFFQMCRAHGIGYDIKEKQGTVFTLIDSFNRESLGMLAVSDNLQGALATFARNLSVIHQEISAPNMQGESNFKPVIEDIEAILGTTLQNAEEQASGEQDTTGTPDTETN